MIGKRYKIKILFISIFLSIIASIIYYEYFIIKAIILNQAIVENRQTARYYQNNIMNSNPVALNKLNQVNNHKNLLQDNDFINFAKQSMFFLKDIDAKITLFNASGNKFLTNNNNEIKAVEKFASDNFFDVVITKINRYFLKYFIDLDYNFSLFDSKSYNIFIDKALVINKSTEKKS